MQHRHSTILALILLLAGCATASSRPDWVDGTSKRYDNVRYLIGRGEGSTQEDAKNRARADLAKTFEVAIHDESEDVQSYRVVSANKGNVAEHENQIRRALSTRTDQIVSGIQIADLWEDPVTKTQYALAVLPRAQAATGLRQQIAELDDATQSYIAQAQRAPDLFARIGAASEALAMQQEREGYQRSLIVVDPSGRGVEPVWNTAKLAADLAGLLKRVRIAPHVVNSSLDGLDDALAGGLAAAGFSVQRTEDAAYTLDGTLDVADLGRKEGWYWVNGTLEIKLTDHSTGRVVGTHRWNIKAAGTDPLLARQRAMADVARILKRETRSTLLGFAAARN